MLSMVDVRGLVAVGDYVMERRRCDDPYRFLKRSPEAEVSRPATGGPSAHAADAYRRVLEARALAVGMQILGVQFGCVGPRDGSACSPYRYDGETGASGAMLA